MPTGLYFLEHFATLLDIVIIRQLGFIPRKHSLADGKFEVIQWKQLLRNAIIANRWAFSHIVIIAK